MTSRRGRAAVDLQVGLLVLVGTALLVGGYLLTRDGVLPGESAYRVSVVLPTADGLWPGSSVRLAGVDIGSVEGITLEGGAARLTLRIRAGHPLPADSSLQPRSSGMLGDKHLAVILGQADRPIPAEAELAYAPASADLDALMGQAAGVTEDVQAITRAVRASLQDESNQAHAQALLRDSAQLIQEIRALVADNRSALNATLASLRSTSFKTAEAVDAVHSGATDELVRLQQATDELQALLGHLRSISAKVDGGQGSLGGLVNERAALDALEGTLASAQARLDQLPRLEWEGEVGTRLYLGSQPSGAGLERNPLTPWGADLGVGGATQATLEVRGPAGPGLLLGLADHPQGQITTRRETAAGQSTDPQTTQRDGLRPTAMATLRPGAWQLRAGLREGGLGAGFGVGTGRVSVEADLFDLRHGAWPADDLLPNLRLAGDLQASPHLHLQLGAEQPLLGARYGFATGFAGASWAFGSAER